MSQTTCCSSCSCTPSTDRPAYTWSMTVVDGRRSWTCAPCSRAQVTAIESGLLLRA